MIPKGVKNQNRTFGLVMAGAFITLAVIRFIGTGEVTNWLLGLGLVLAIVGFLVPSWLGPIRVVWMKLAGFLGFVNSRILLTIVFIGLITPMALILRLTGQRPIQGRRKSVNDSHWHPRQPEEFSAKRMERQF